MSQSEYLRDIFAVFERVLPSLDILLIFERVLPNLDILPLFASNKY